jgi:UTP--glucose-1-phosphate uridylyltransferase
MLREGERVVGVRLPPDEKRYDIGNFESYFETFVEFALTDPEFGPRLRQHVKELLK